MEAKPKKPNNRGISPGRTKGKTVKRGKLTPTEQANLVLMKENKPNGEKGTDIADKFGVSLSTVAHLTADGLTNQAKQIYKQKKARLAELSIDVVEAALVKSKDLIDIADDPKYLAGVSQAGRFADTVYRLETNQPTEIKRTLQTEEHALEFIKMLMLRMDLATALESFLKTSLEPIVPDHSRAEIVRRIESGDLKLLTA